MTKVKRLFGIFILCVAPSLLSAQSSDSWTLYRDLDAVKIDYQLQQCGTDVITEFNFVRLTNKTNKPILVSFKIEYYYNGSCSTCGTNEYQFTFSLAPNESIMPSCGDLSSPNGRLAIINKYVNRNYGHPLDRFELSNIIVQ